MWSTSSLRKDATRRQVNDAPAVIDASALLALIFGERLSGASGAFENGIMSTVNLTGVFAKMVDVGAAAEDAVADIEALWLHLAIVAVHRGGRVAAAELRGRPK